MTAREFVCKIVEIARAQHTEHTVIAVDFEPTTEGLKLTFRFKEPIRGT